MTEKRAAAAILALFVAFGVGYSLLMPIWEAPDERPHYGYASSIAWTGEPPAIEDNYEALQPQLYYRIAAVPIRLIAAFDPALARRFLPPLLPMEENLPRYDWTAENYVFLLAPLAVRWMGIGFGALALVCVYTAVRRTLPDEPVLALGAIALVGGIPQFIHLAASVNNDVLAILAGAALFFGIAAVCRQDRFEWTWIAVFALGLILPAAVKLTVLPLGLAAAAVVVYRIWEMREGLPRRLLAGGAALTVAAIAALPAIFPGPFHGLLLELRFRLLTVRPDFWDASIPNVAFRYMWSFWGKVGWLSVGIPRAAVIGLTLLAGVGFAAALRELFFRRAADDPAVAVPARRLLLSAVLAVGIAGPMLLANFTSSPQAQGRFLFPTLAPFALLTVFGWSRLLGERRRFLVPAIIVLFALLNLHLWVTGVIPVYFQPFLDR